MKEAPDILKILEKDIKIPERVNEKAEEAFRKIYAGRSNGYYSSY